MKSITRLLMLSGLAATLLLGACATQEPKKPSPYDDSVSTLPHNRPESWEGSAGFGSFFPQSQ